MFDFQRAVMKFYNLGLREVKRDLRCPIALVSDDLGCDGNGLRPRFARFARNTHADKLVVGFRSSQFRRA